MRRSEIKCNGMNTSILSITKLPTIAAVGMATAALLLASCNKSVNYTAEDAPLHRGIWGENAPVKVDSLTVASYNIQYGEDIDQALNDVQANPHLREADILLLQEMDPTGTETLAKALRRHFVYYPASVNPHHARLFGNAVLSRWPITNQKVFLLPHGHPLSGHRRIAVATDIDLGDQILRAVSVHTATVVMTQDRRMDQAQAALDSLGLVDGPVVIGGDFNTVSDYEVTLIRRRFRRADFRWAKLPEGPTVKKNKIRRLIGQELVLDHIFYRNMELRSTGLASEAAASDHLPIWAVFSILGSVAKDREAEVE